MSGHSLSKHQKRLRTSLALLVFAGLILVFTALLPTVSRATFTPDDPTGATKNSRTAFVPGEILVRYRTEAIAKHQTEVAGESGIAGQIVVNAQGRAIAIRLERFGGSDIVPGLRIAHVAAHDTLAAVEALQKQPNVVYAEPNYLLYPDVTNPNDPRFVSNELYGLTKIAAPLAWDTTPGSSSVVVGVIDEGIDTVHQDLQANIWTNPGETPNGVDDDSNGFIDDIHGYNFAADSGTIPADFHGTHVGGTIGATGNNGIGVVGVNWNVRLMSLKFIASGTGSTADAIRACNYAKQMRDRWISSGGSQGANLRVLNNSYGGGGFSQSFLDAIGQLSQSGILFVASGGNIAAGSTEPNNEIVPHYPSSYVASNVVGVASTDVNDNLSGSSHYGLTTIHLGAPGSGILSTTPGNNYGFSSGTSMATPHVSGSAALLLAQNPNLTLQQLKSLLIFNGDSVAALSNKTVTGRRLNVFKSFQALAENDTTPPGTVTGLQVNTQTGRSFNLGWTASGDDGAAGQASLYQLTFTDATTSAVIQLTNVLPVASGVVQSVDVKLPYRHTAGTITLREFDNVGNEGTPATLVVSVPLNLGDPYLTSLSSPAALSTGGTALGLIGDDKLKLNHSLPFAFPFFGETFSAVHVSTNGNLYFSTPPTRANGDADDVPSSVGGLTKFKMIAGLWDDLRTDRAAGHDVYVTADESHVIFRWQGVTFGDGTPATEFAVNFEIELLPNGTIHTRYGSGNTNLFPVVGIAGGEPEAYFVPSHTSEQTAINLTNAQQVTFTPRTTSTVTRTLTVASSNPDSGVSIIVSPTDNGGQTTGNTQFARVYNDGVTVQLQAPASAGGNLFLRWQRDGLNWSESQITSIVLDADHTMTAVYAPAGETVQFVSTAFDVFENGSSVSVTVSRNGSLSTPASVDYTTVDGTATQKGDYIFSAGRLNFAVNEGSKSFTVLIIDDVFVEGIETFGVVLSNPVGTSLNVVRTTATVRIFDSETSATANPLDNSDARFFVRQHYLDFLNREPDTSGLDFWRDQITSCGTNVACIEVRRINVSAAFFRSIEFQETGYLIERLYKVAYGDAIGTSTFNGTHQLAVPIVRYQEFLPDSQQIGAGVVVGQPGWEVVLENSKRNFTAAFVARARFTTAFPAGMSSTDYVETLNTNAGGVLTPAERNQLIFDLMSDAKTRAEVLRQVAEDPDLKSAEDSRAFVLMQYFGYLRRNPNDPPEPGLDYTGYDFWLTKLNQFNGNFIDAEMVKAFISASEYRHRFGP